MSEPDHSAVEDGPQRRPPWWRPFLPLALLALVLASWLGSAWPEPPAPVAIPTATVTAPALAAKEAPPSPSTEGPYLIAHLPGDVPAFDQPGGTEIGTVAGEWWGYPSALPVIERTAGFLLVRVQQRPNGSTAWIAADGIDLSETYYRITVDLEAQRLKLLNAGVVEMDVPAIVGRPATPTPVGNFFVTMLQPGPSSSYGQLVLVLSAHSETIDNWQGSGDAVSAIHGPLGNESSIDTAGAISNGCIRLHMADLDALAAVVPPGTPVDIA